MRKILFALLLAPLVFTACKKEDSIPNEFIINGIHDVDMGATAGNVLPLAITLSSGAQEQVSLSATGLPAGISVVFAPANGTPSFTTVATFSGTAAAGTYPIKLVGTSASYTRSYDLNLTVPAMNGWMLDGTIFNKGSIYISGSSGYGVIYATSATSGTSTSSLTIQKMGAFPTGDGTYTYPVGDPYSGGDHVGIDVSDGSSSNVYSNLTNSTTTLTLVISGGKIKATLPATTVATSSTATTTKTLVVNLQQ